MDAEVARHLNEGLSITGNVAWIPESWCDDRGRMITVREAIHGSALTRDTVQHAIRYGHIQAMKDANGRLRFRLREWTRFFGDKYRYAEHRARYGRTGRAWTCDELGMLRLPLSHRVMATVLQRSPAAIKIMRFRIGISISKLMGEGR